ncbi:N-acetyltransferase eso1, partial [Coemansia sp. RSA 552]
MDTAREAREKCPGLVLVHVATFTDGTPAAYHKAPSANTHKVSLDEYRRASRKIMELFKRLCPTMNKASIDEAYLDVSEAVRGQILDDLDRGVIELTGSTGAMSQAMYSQISRSDGADTALLAPVVRWVTVSRKGKEKEPAAGSAPTEYGVLVGGVPPITFGWGDLVLRYCATLARNVRSALFRELGYRASAGVAHNRFLAKIGSGLNKPDQQTVFLQSQAEAFLRTYPLTKIPSLGGKLGVLVESAFGAQTAGDLMNYTVDQMAFKVGADQARHLYNRCRGIDDSPVVDNREPGTLSSTKNFLRYPVDSMAKLDRWVSINGMDLWTRVTEEWEMRRRWPRSLTVAYTTQGLNQRSKTVLFPGRFIKGSMSSPDVVIGAVRACLAAVASGNDPETGQGLRERSPSQGRVDTGGRANAGGRGTLFPVTGLSLTAKGFQRELANVSAMERWLAKARTENIEVANSAELNMLQKQSELAERMDVDERTTEGSASLLNSMSGTGTPEFDEGRIPELQPQKLSTMLRLTSQPTTQIPANQQRQMSVHSLLPPSCTSDTTQGLGLPSHTAPTNRDHGAYVQPSQAPIPDSPPSTSSSSARTPPLATRSYHFPPSDGTAAGAPGAAANDAQVRGYFASALQSTLVPSDREMQPGLVSESEYESSDSELSCLRTPPGSESEGYEEENEDGEEDEDGEDGQSEGVVQSAVARPGADMVRTELPARGQGRSRTSSGGDGDTDHRPASRATTVTMRRRTSVYIQPNTDQESAARYGEGYKNMNIDRFDDGSLEVAAPDEGQAASGDGFVPALIAATRRKREIQIVRFQHPVDTPDDAISGGRSAIRGGRGGPNSRASSNRHSRSSSCVSNAGESSLMASVRSRGEEGEPAIAEEEDEDSSDDGLDSVLNMAVTAMMNSISASQTTMEIRCPQCAESAGPIPAAEWDTHRDWHIARHLQEREMRHESVARHIQSAFASSESASRPAPKRARHEPSNSGGNSGGGDSRQRRQQTIAEAWK